MACEYPEGCSCGASAENAQEQQIHNLCKMNNHTFNNNIILWTIFKLNCRHRKFSKVSICKYYIEEKDCKNYNNCPVWKITQELLKKENNETISK
jgi:hypothetical protein